MFRSDTERIYRGGKTLSSKITLRLPFLDIECLKEAISACGHQFTLQARSLCLSNGIVIGQTDIGFIAQVEYIQKPIMDAIYKQYEVLYKERVKKLQETQNALNYLIKQEQEKAAELQRLRQQMKAANVSKISEVEQELQSLKQGRQTQAEETTKVIEENKTLQSEKEQYLANIAKKIEEQAARRGYQVKRIQQQGKTQLVLIRTS